MILASTTVPCFNCSPSASRWRLISSSNPLPSAAASSRWRKLRIVVSSGIASEEPQPHEALHGEILVQRVLHRRVAEVVDQLHDVHPQHQ